MFKTNSMYQACKAKFEQNPNLSSFLWDTGYQAELWTQHGKDQSGCEKSYFQFETTKCFLLTTLCATLYSAIHFNIEWLDHIYIFYYNWLGLGSGGGGGMFAVGLIKGHWL